VSYPAKASHVTASQRMLMPALLVAAACLLYFPRLEVPPRYIYDEAYHAYTAAQYVVGNSDAFLWNTRPPRSDVGYTWNHPPAGLLLMAGGIALLDDRPLGWRFASAVFGVLGIALTLLLAWLVTRDSRVAHLAAGLLLLDGLYFVQARTAMLDMFVTVFMLGSFLGLYWYVTSPPHRVRGPLLATGSLFGLAIATKWNAAYPALLIGCVALVRLLRLWRQARRGVRQHLVWVPLALIILPLAIYLAAYTPFFAAGYGLSDFLALQQQILRYHTHLTATHGYQSAWWQWPLAARPVWYHVNYGPGMVANIYAQGNPILFWALVPAAAWLSWRWWRAHNPALIVLLIGFFGQWLPWALVPRIAFLYHFLPAVPFGGLAVSIAVIRLWEGRTATRVLAAGYVAAVALAFVFFHPIYAAVPLTWPALEERLWFERWR
jgi:dolichyl-phosphate-mannose-protein mannosyltransferase